MTVKIAEYTWHHTVNINVNVFYSTFTNFFYFVTFYVFFILTSAFLHIHVCMERVSVCPYTVSSLMADLTGYWHDTADSSLSVRPPVWLSVTKCIVVTRYHGSKGRFEEKFKDTVKLADQLNPRSVEHCTPVLRGYNRHWDHLTRKSAATWWVNTKRLPGAYATTFSSWSIVHSYNDYLPIRLQFPSSPTQTSSALHVT